MANLTLSPNMGLPVPTVAQDPGPDWATNINASLSIVDQHNHTPGAGVAIPPAGLNINADLPFNNNNLTLARTVRFSIQPSPLGTATDLGCLYVSGVDLYYNDVSGNQIKMTAGGTVNATSSGISSGTATASFVASTLVVNSASNTPANIQCASILLGNNSAGTNYVTLSPPSSLAASYSLVLPLVPATLSFMAIDASGNMSAYAATASGLTGSNLINNINLPGTSVQENGNNLVVSNTNATKSLAIIRGYVNGVGFGNIISGEGFSFTKVSTGVYVMPYTTTLGDVPAATASIETGLGFIQVAPFSNQVQVQTYNTSGTATDMAFSFIVIGQRA